MDEQTILSKLKEILKTALPNFDNVDNITPNSRLIEDLGLTSIAFVYMAFAIEKEFNISMEGISFKSFITVSDVIKYILNK
ncbi:MAG: acyl carrier protein [Mycoplasmoidaceae bacterium]|nr:acyl carrier protein [Mycoplasmoidaceae bacterium]